jgi:hypothetical protein
MAKVPHKIFNKGGYMEKVTIKFLKDHRMMFEGKMVSFRVNDIAEVSKETGLELFRLGLALPGPQFGKPIKNRFEK